MLGGIARRATTINEMGPEPKLILDLGNFSSAGTDQFSRLKIEALLESYTAIGYNAVNIGRYEISQGKDFILETNDMLGGKLISANVLDADGNASCLCRHQVSVPCGSEERPRLIHQMAGAVVRLCLSSLRHLKL